MERVYHTSRIFLLLLFVFCALKSIAGEQITQNGITFELDGDKHVATIVATSYTQFGDYELPQSITAGGITYTLTGVGEDAFKDCVFGQLVIPPQITDMKNNSFGNCTISKLVWQANKCNDFVVKKLIYPYIQENDTIFDVFYENMYPYYPFQSTAISTIVVTENVKKVPYNFVTGSTGHNTIEWNAADCDDFYTRAWTRTDEYIPDFVSNLYHYFIPFKNSTASKLIVGEQVKHLPMDLLTDMNNLHNVEWNATECGRLLQFHHDPYEEENGVYSYYLNNPLFYNLPVDNITFGDNVRKIPELLCNNSKITSVTIPAGVEEIGGGAFANCKSLTTVTWNAVNCDPFSGIVYQGIDGDWDRIGQFTEVDYPSIFTRSAITSFTTGEGVTSMPAGLLKNISSLQELNLSNSVYYIEPETLEGTQWYNSQPDGVVYAGRVAYGYKGKFRGNSLTLKKECNSITERAFASCNGLTSLTLLGGLEYVGAFAFPNSITDLFLSADVTSLKGLHVAPSEIYSYAETPPTCDNNSFYRYTGNLHVLRNAISAYFRAPFWSQFEHLTGDASIITEIDFETDSLTMMVGDTNTLVPTIVPSETQPSQLSWASSDLSVATISADGVVTAIAPGETDITASFMEISTSCHIVVKKAIVELDKNKININIGDEIQLNVNVLPTPDISGENPVWRSSDNAIAVVSNNGLVKGMAVGTTTITATYMGVVASCTVKVSEPPITISLDNHNVRINEGELFNITPTSSPIDVTFTANVMDTTVAICRVLNSKINILGIGGGETLLIVGANNSNVVTDTCRITVVSESGIFAIDGIQYAKNENGNSVTVTYRNDENSFADNYAGLTSAVIPEEITYDGDNYQVTAIGNNAFRKCTSLGEVVIPSSVKEIGELAFYNCTALTSISIPESVEQLGRGAFGSCTQLQHITVHLDNPAFDSRDNCNAIIETANNTLVVGSNNTVIPQSVTAIGNDAFSGYSQLTAIQIPSSVTSIGNGAFYSCRGLAQIQLPNSVVSIGNNAFKLCTGLNNVNLPQSVTTIGNSAFNSCTKLKTLTLGSAIESIGSEAFAQDKALEHITCQMLSPGEITYGTSIFSNTTPTKCRLTVPIGTLEAYRAQEPWSAFINIDQTSNGDLNGDGNVNTGDVSTLYRAILSNDNDAIYDINGDGNVNIGDISAIYSLILN